MLIDDLLRFTIRQGASDLHVKPARPPLLRIQGRLVPVKADPLPPEAVRSMLTAILDERQRQCLERDFYVDLAYSLPGESRFRATIYHQRGSLSGVFRSVPYSFPTLDEWGLPEVLKEFVPLPQGLVLVTGPAGSGKSSTLAALIREIVDSRPVHVVSIEDPIEFLINDGAGSISQREVGSDTRSFADALRNTLRQDPDVIMIGEMRDPETIATAVNAAETGHLVLSTLHTNSAAQTVERVVAAFPEGQHRHVRQKLAEVLQAVISLRLVERADGSGRVAAVEVMKGTPRVRKLIQDGNLQDLQEEIERSVAFERMQTINQSLAALVINGVVSREEAMVNSASPADLDLLLRKALGMTRPEGVEPEEDMASSTADFSQILRLQEINKAYDELQERFEREIAERDAHISQMEEELRGRDTTLVEEKFRALMEEKEKLVRQVAFQRQDYEAKIDKLQHRIRELTSAATPVGSGYRR